MWQCLCIVRVVGYTRGPLRVFPLCWFRGSKFFVRGVYIRILCRKNPKKGCSEIKRQRLVSVKQALLYYSWYFWKWFQSSFCQYWLQNELQISKFGWRFVFLKRYGKEVMESIHTFRFGRIFDKDIETHLMNQPNNSNNDIRGMDIVFLKEWVPYISESSANKYIQSFLRKAGRTPEWRLPIRMCHWRRLIPSKVQ